MLRVTYHFIKMKFNLFDNLLNIPLTMLQSVKQFKFKLGPEF